LPHTLVYVLLLTLQPFSLLFPEALAGQTLDTSLRV
jgi:hypothetical protein